MNDNNVTIAELRSKVKKFVSDRDWDKYHNPKNLSMSIAIEAAELMEEFQWIDINESLEAKERGNFENIKEELADIMIYCMSFANSLDIDVTRAILSKLEKNEKRFPS